MVRIVFVILHYETVSDTMDCLNSLLKYLSRDYVDVVVVDNGSKQGKLIEIAEIYNTYSQIHFIYSKENLGFAKGNNIGYKYAKYDLKAELIILANNDLVFRQENFIDLLVENYEKTQFDVAGPEIISLLDNLNQNPVPRLFSSMREVQKKIVKLMILYTASYFNLDLILKKFFSNGIHRYDNDTELGDFQLHGACMFFANQYIDRYDGLYNKTFMYGEENILKFIIERNRLNMQYIKEVSVFHKEGSSTQAIWGKGKKNRQFYYKWNVHSCILLKKLMTNKELFDFL